MATAEEKEDDPDWVTKYFNNTASVFEEKFEKSLKRFPDAKKCIGMYEQKLKEYHDKGLPLLRRALEEIHNELCVANALLTSSDPYFTNIQYEPSLSGSSKSIDFVATSSESLFYVDVKTIMPDSKDKWVNFIENRKHIPENMNVTLDKEFMGGEIWHKWCASRGRMLEYSLELEAKIKEGNLSNGKSIVIMAFCGNGVDWHESKLEDFVSFYMTGVHRYDDAFSEMENHYIKEKNISLSRSITKFSFVERRFGWIEAKKVNWTPPPI